MPQSLLTINECRSFLKIKPQVSMIQTSPGTLVELADLADAGKKDVQADQSGLNLFLPVVIRKSQQSYWIIDGARRLRHMAPDLTINCLMLDFAMDCTELQAGLARLSIKNRGSLELLEKISALRWINLHATLDDSAAIAGLLGISKSDYHELQPLTDCPAHILEAVSQGIIHVPCVNDLRLLSDEDQSLFITTFLTLRLSLQTQREFLEWLPELAYTRKQSIAMVLSDPLLADIMHDKKLNNPQKIELLRQTLFAMRFPTLSAMQTAWLARTREVNPDPKIVQFSHSPAFEKNKLEIKLVITDGGQIPVVLAGLQKIDADTWEKLIYPG